MPLQQSDIDDLVAAWRGYCAGITDWQALVRGTVPKQTGCGSVYELPNPLKNRLHESFAICDMRNIKVAEPHYHPADNWEFYFVLSGTARVFVGGQAHDAKKGDAIIIPPDTAHYTIPGADFVVAAVNNPPFRPESYITLGAADESRLEVEFDLDKFRRLTSKL
ncbi:MAG TPA: cupin domain-containing protein [Candidatus Saccharimonadales bacterium]|nr:cupin domain-containing protein [Candidatus Saccharimonadales bacterium]